jgi:hypothetical protein
MGRTNEGVAQNDDMFAPGIGVDLVSIVDSSQSEDVFQFSTWQIAHVSCTRITNNNY